MRVNQFHRVVRLEGQAARQHLIKGDAQRIKIAAIIERLIHASGLFGRHVGERALHPLQTLGDGRFARQLRSDAEIAQLQLSGLRVDKDVVGLDVFVNHATRVNFAKRGD